MAQLCTSGTAASARKDTASSTRRLSGGEDCIGVLDSKDAEEVSEESIADWEVEARDAVSSDTETDDPWVNGPKS